IDSEEAETVHAAAPAHPQDLSGAARDHGEALAWRADVLQQAGCLRNVRQRSPWRWVCRRVAACSTWSAGGAHRRRAFRLLPSTLCRQQRMDRHRTFAYPRRCAHWAHSRGISTDCLEEEENEESVIASAAGSCKRLLDSNDIFTLNEPAGVLACRDVLENNVARQ